MSEDFQGTATGANYLSPEDEARRAELCKTALHYASDLHFAVIPVRWITRAGVCSCVRGAECASPGKHPVHDAWGEHATLDPIEVAHWWRPRPPDHNPPEWFPAANIGIVTGRKSGVWVLDVDTYSGGEARLAGYENRHGPMPETRVHGTGSDGFHFFFSYPADFEIKNDAKKVLGAGLDIRGQGGFVVAPPSVSAKGSYKLNPAHDIAPAEAPEWLTGLLRGYYQEQTGQALAARPPESGGAGPRRYAEAALRSEAERMRRAAPGTRNDTLNQCAFSLGTLGGAGLLEESAAYATLHEAALDSGLNPGEVRATFLSGWKAGLENPREVQWNIRQEWPQRARNDFGLADRMVDHCAEMLNWVPEWGTWAVYQHGIWRKDEKATGERYAQMMLRSLADTEALTYDEDPGEAPDGSELPSDRQGFLEWVAKQQYRKSVSAAAQLCMGLPAMRMSQSSLDTDPMKLNVRNGVVDLATGELLEHSPDHRMTLQASASYQPHAPSSQWEEFLRRVQPDPQVRAYLQRVAGYCATGLTSEQVMFLWHGSGANGKSVAQAVIAKVLGAYAQVMPVSTLMASSIDDRIPNDVARMVGKRFLIASETKQGARFDEARMKQLTGGDVVSARFMRSEFFDFRPDGKIQLTTNHLPPMSDDDATWRRIHLIPWPVVIPKAEQDGGLQDRLIAEESAGILWWIIEGCLAWQTEGLNPPAALHEAIAAYRIEEDVVQQFVLAMLDVVEEHTRHVGRSTAEIHSAFEAWAAAEHLGPQGKVSQRALTERLKKRGFRYYRDGTWAGFPGLRVRSTIG